MDKPLLIQIFTKKQQQQKWQIFTITQKLKYLRPTVVFLFVFFFGKSKHFFHFQLHKIYKHLDLWAMVFLLRLNNTISPPVLRRWRWKKKYVYFRVEEIGFWEIHIEIHETYTKIWKEKGWWKEKTASTYTAHNQMIIIIIITIIIMSRAVKSLVKAYISIYLYI